jgi:hypothetical protein
VAQQTADVLEYEGTGWKRRGNRNFNNKVY